MGDVLSQAGYHVQFQRIGSYRILCEIVFIRQKWAGTGDSPESALDAAIKKMEEAR